MECLANPRSIIMGLVEHDADNLPARILLHHPIDLQHIPHQPLQSKALQAWCSFLQECIKLWGLCGWAALLRLEVRIPHLEGAAQLSVEHFHSRLEQQMRTK